ncbi:MAG: hypothetical protein M0Z99_34610 [Betaproteobacteria bacterium]|nr:hypothetical protein [Betaproteobacteria bacterium]
MAMQTYTADEIEALNRLEAGWWAGLTEEQRARGLSEYEHTALVEAAIELLTCHRSKLRKLDQVKVMMARLQLARGREKKIRRLAAAEAITEARNRTAALIEFVVDLLKLMLAAAKPQRDEFLRPAPVPSLAGRAIADLNLTPRVLAQRPQLARV